MRMLQLPPKSPVEVGLLKQMQMLLLMPGSPVDLPQLSSQLPSIGIRAFAGENGGAKATIFGTGIKPKTITAGTFTPLPKSTPAQIKKAIELQKLGLANPVQFGSGNLGASGARPGATANAGVIAFARASAIALAQAGSLSRAHVDTSGGPSPAGNTTPRTGNTPARTPEAPAATIADTDSKDYADGEVIADNDSKSDYGYPKDTDVLATGEDNDFIPEDAYQAVEKKRIQKEKRQLELSCLIFQL
jgi:hypothetical protein